MTDLHPSAGGSPRSARPPGSKARRHSLASELWHLVKTTRKWWLVPILLAIAILALFVILGSSSVAPFIYSIF